MNIMSKLTLRQMRMNKRRTIVTIVGVIISVAMFTAVATLGGSFLGFMQQLVISQNGDYHVMYGGINSSSLQTLKEDEKVESYYTVQSHGLSELPEQFGAKQFLWVKAVSMDGMEQAGVTLTEGRLPQNSSELVLSESIRARDGEYMKLGDTVTLTLGERRLIDKYTGEVLPESFPIDGDVSYMGDEETFVPVAGDAERTYTIVGFAAMFPLEPSWAPALTAVTGQDDPNAADLGVFLKVKDVDPSVYDWADGMYSKLGASWSSTNTSLLLYSGADYDMEFMQMIYVLVGILFAIIFIGSVALIYNAFAISVTERSVNFGLLASVGATNRQKRRSVLFEAIVILLIAVPLGIIGGILGMQGVFLLVNPTVQSLLNSNYDLPGVGLHVVVSPLAILTAVGLSIVTVLVSAWIPAIRASRVSPMEAIRQQRDIQLTPRSVKTSRLTRKLFGIEGELAAKTMKRNKKRYRIAISSFVISLVLFLSASSFTHFLSNSVDLAVEDANYDMEVAMLLPGAESEMAATPGSVTIGEVDADAKQTDYQKLASGLIADIRAMEGVTESVVLRTWGYTTFIDNAAYETAELQKLTAEDSDSPMAGTMPMLRISAMDDASLQAYCKQIGASYEAMQNADRPSAILINDLVWKDGRTYESFSGFNLQKGDTLPFTYVDTLDNETKEGALLMEAVTGETVLGLSGLRHEGTGLTFDVIISQKVFDEYLDQLNVTGTRHDLNLYLNAADPDKVEDRIWELWEMPENRNLSIGAYNLASSKRQIEQLIFLINTFSYVFIGLISAIGVANIFNTISTSIILRKREFAMLKSVGMTPRGFHKMLFFESLFYGLKSLLIGLPVSGVMMGLLYLVLRSNFDLAFSVPWLQVGIGIASIFVIVLSTVIYAGRKIRREGILNGLRNSNL